MEKRVFLLAGMKCAHCEMNVERALTSLEGVSSAKASRAEGSVSVEYDASAVTPEEMKAAVESLGRFVFSF